MVNSPFRHCWINQNFNFIRWFHYVFLLFLIGNFNGLAKFIPIPLPEFAGVYLAKLLFSLSLDRCTPPPYSRILAAASFNAG